MKLIECNLRGAVLRKKQQASYYILLLFHKNTRYLKDLIFRLWDRETQSPHNSHNTTSPPHLPHYSGLRGESGEVRRDLVEVAMAVRRPMAAGFVAAAAFLPTFVVATSTRSAATAPGAPTAAGAPYAGMTTGAPWTRSSQASIGGGMLREAPWTRALATSATGGATSDQGSADACSNNSSMLFKAWWMSNDLAASSRMLSAPWIRNIELSTEDDTVPQVCPSYTCFSYSSACLGRVYFIFLLFFTNLFSMRCAPRSQKSASLFLAFWK